MVESLTPSQLVAFLPNIGTTELIIIFFVVLLLFGAKKLPELARGMGKSIKEFKKATSEIEDEVRTAIESSDTDATPPSSNSSHSKDDATATNPKEETEEQKAKES
ncbi:MAG: Sec-independent protein translocase protein TatA [Candidatus Moanabacter tarae]|mgnify:FL=1|uniref:Sec-independent protein translocase protein TatA n=1 Tax=Candidatus Moanibacter tarae TaxID=2200854 RepID=A0A2Z4AMH3_9BACT|nr:MAG: Sec-independent protein translocase protein TatA [Candidatus Moanabacter tarae]|tara:strand:- start:17730 stop:18047 length:318 start_codon:yes stop_codon:yes gene_type:complete